MKKKGGSLKDIENGEDIQLLVEKFYQKIVSDDVIGHFFTTVIELDLDKHLPVICDFWETTLLGNMKYKGNPMVKHIELSKKEKMTEQHFETWLSHWESTITDNFQGPKAEEAILRASQIAGLMKFKIQNHGT